MPDVDMTFSLAEAQDNPWARDLLEATSDHTGDNSFLQPDAPADPARVTRTLAIIRDIGNDLAAVVNLVSSTVRTQRASQDASDRADTALALLEAQYGRQASEALGAAAIRQARAMITAARTQDDIATAAVFLRRAMAVRDAQRLSESSPASHGPDLLVVGAGAAALLLAVWYYRSRSTRRPRPR